MNGRRRELERRIDNLTGCSAYIKDYLVSILDSDTTTDHMDADVRVVIDRSTCYDSMLTADILSVLNDIFLFRRDIFEQSAKEASIEEGYADTRVSKDDIRRHKNSLGYVLRRITDNIRIIKGPHNQEARDAAENDIVTSLIILREIDIVEHHLWLHKYKRALEHRAREHKLWR